MTQNSIYIIVITRDLYSAYYKKKKNIGATVKIKLKTITIKPGWIIRL